MVRGSKYIGFLDVSKFSCLYDPGTAGKNQCLNIPMAVAPKNVPGIHFHLGGS